MKEVKQKTAQKDGWEYQGVRVEVQRPIISYFLKKKTTGGE